MIMTTSFNQQNSPVLNWRYQVADVATLRVIEQPFVNSDPVMNWRYRSPSETYRILKKSKSAAVVNWRYQVSEISVSNLN
jgi:hypothetical protein